MKIKKQEAQKSMSKKKENLNLKTIKAVSKELKLKIKQTIQKKIKFMEIVLKKIIKNT